MASRGESVDRLEPGMIVKPRRGRGRRWQVAGRSVGTLWRLDPLGDDIGGWSGVKAISVEEERLLSDWVRG